MSDYPSGQLILAMKREDGDFDTIVAIQNSDVGINISPVKEILKIKKSVEQKNPGCDFVIFNMDELTDVIDGSCNNWCDVTKDCMSEALKEWGGNDGICLAYPKH